MKLYYKAIAHQHMHATKYTKCTTSSSRHLHISTYIAFVVNYLSLNDFSPFIKLNSFRVKVKFIASGNFITSNYTHIVDTMNF